jgi:hypothetical protein
VTRVRAALLVLLATVLGGCATGGPDAGAVASSTLDDVTEHWSRFGGPVRTGEDLAASAIERSAESPGYQSVQVEALDWRGTTGTDDGATVVLRVVAHVEARDSTALFESDVPESDAVVCTRFVLGAGRDRHAVEEEPVSCPDGAQARTPRPPREPEVPGDTEDRLVTVLGRTDPASLQRDVERALAGEDVTVSTGADRDEDDGRVSWRPSVSQAARTASSWSAGGRSVRNGWAASRASGCSPARSAARPRSC